MGFSKEHKSKTGGLPQKGRDYFKKTEGSNLKKPVNKGTNPRRVSFAARLSLSAAIQFFLFAFSLLFFLFRP